MNSTSTSNKEKLYLDLKRRILTLDLAPGIDLDEVSISQEYGLSRTPLRDVFRQLAGEGYITIIGNKGAHVSPMDHKTLKEFFQTAPMIYTAISRLAVENATSAQVRELKAVQGRFRQAATRIVVKDLVYFNDRFHSLIGEMADNRYLSISLQRLLVDHARIAHTFYDRKNAKEGDRLKLAVEQHDQLLEAIDKGDAEQAVAVTLAHWELSRSQAELFVNAEPIPVSVIAS